MKSQPQPKLVMKIIKKVKVMIQQKKEKNNNKRKKRKKINTIKNLN